MNIDLRTATLIAFILIASSAVLSLFSFLWELYAYGAIRGSLLFTFGNFVEILAFASLALFLWTLYQKQK